MRELRLGSIIPERTYDVLCGGVEEDIAEILERCPPAQDYHDTKDFLNLDQRLCNFTLLWREFLSAPFINVRNPFLDNSILDFVMRIPSHWRRGKRFYIETINEMLPELFRFRKARTFSHAIAWKESLIAQTRAIEQSISSQDSRLDDIIPVDSILRLLEQNRTNARRFLKTRIIHSTRRLLRETPLAGTFAERKMSGFCRKLPVREDVEFQTFLKRALIARSALVRR